MTALKILVGHKRPAFQLWPGWKFLGPNPHGPDDIILDDLQRRNGQPDDGLLALVEVNSPLLALNDSVAVLKALEL